MASRAAAAWCPLAARTAVRCARGREVTRVPTANVVRDHAITARARGRSWHDPDGGGEKESGRLTDLFETGSPEPWHAFGAAALFERSTRDHLIFCSRTIDEEGG